MAWCVDCDDTGWIIRYRPSTVTGASVSYAEPCPCRVNNPAYQRKQAQMRRVKTTPRKREA